MKIFLFIILLIIQSDLRFLASAFPYKKVKLSSNISGKVKKIFFNEGDIVKKNEIVALIDDTDFKIELERAKALIKKASAELKLCKIKLEKLKISPVIETLSKTVEITILLNNRNFLIKPDISSKSLEL